MWFSWKYFLLLHFAITLILTVQLGLKVAVFDLKGTVQEAVNIMPPDLTITYHKEGRISINQDLPYAIPLPAGVKDDNDAHPANLIVFDSEEDPSQETFFDYDTAILVTETQIHALDQGGQSMMRQAKTYVVPQGEEDFLLDRATLDNGAKAFFEFPVIRTKLYVPLLMLIVFPIFYCVIVLLRILMIAFFTVFSWALAKLFLNDRHYTYAMLFRVSLHSVTLILIVSYLMHSLGLTFFRGFVYFFAFLLWTMYILSNMAPVHHAHPHPKKTPPRKKKSS